MNQESTLIELNKKGLIPGADETLEDYQKRANYCLSLKKNIKQELGKEVPFSEFPQHIDSACLNKIQGSYDIYPGWVPLFYTDYQLSVWQGGCAWIFKVADEAPLSAFIQLRSQFLKSDYYLKIYKREEILIHELSHIGRLAFNEPKFEEFFAYRTSTSSFRKLFGPIIKSSFESLIFIITLFLILILDLSAISMGNRAFYSIALWSKLVPVILIAVALIRLLIRHLQFYYCLKKISVIAKDKNKALSIQYRLLDKEIIAFSRMRVSDIKDYMFNQNHSSLRWQVINKTYFSI